MSEHIEELIMNGRAINQLDDKNDRFPSNLSIQLMSSSPQSLLLQPFLSPTDKGHLLLHKEVVSQMSSLHKFFDTLAYQATTEAQGQEFCGKLLQLKENIRVVHGNRLAKVRDMIREIERQEGMVADRNEYSARMATTRLKQKVHDEVRKASYAWKTLDAVQKMEIQDPTLQQFGVPESSMQDIKEITVDVSCLLHNKETVTSFGKLLSTTGSGLVRLNLISGRADHACLENNQLANDLGAVLGQATSTSIQYLRLSHIEDTVLHNMTSRHKSVRFFRPNKMVECLCFRGKPTSKAAWIQASPSSWLMPWKKTCPVSMLQELVLENVNLAFDISAVCLLNFLLDHQPSLHKLILRHCKIDGGLHRYLALLLQDKVDLVEDITMAGLNLCHSYHGGNNVYYCYNKKLLDKTFQRIQKKKKQQQQRQLLHTKDRSSNKTKNTVSSKPNKSLKRVVIRDLSSSTTNAVSDLCATLGKNSSVADLTLWSHNQSRTRDFRALLQGNGSDISTGMESLGRGATVIHQRHSMISSLQYLDIGGERTQEWIGELTMLVTNPQSVLKCLKVCLGCVNSERIRLREYRRNPTGPSALADYFARLRNLVENGFQGHSTLEKLVFVSVPNKSYENSELLTELGILLKAFTYPLGSRPNTCTNTSVRGRLHSFRYRVPGIRETDPELLDIFREHFCPPHSEEESRGSMLQDIQIGGASRPRSLGIQYHALRVLMQSTMRQALWGCPSSTSSSSLSSSLWPIVLGGLLTWRDNPVAQSMCPKEREQLYLSGIFWSILESPSRMIRELEASDTVWKEETYAKLCPIAAKLMENGSDDDVDVDGYEYRKFWYTHSPY